ncbi:hypothetical protein ACTFIV_001309 [Dictyostelium citrinum]
MFLYSIINPTQQQQNESHSFNDKFNDYLFIYLIPTLIFLITFSIMYYFRKNIRVQIIFIVYLVYRLAFVDNNFYLCTYNNNNNNNNNKINYKYFKLPNQCIHSSLLNTSKIISHPNFCFNVPLGLSTSLTKEENCNNNRICYKRRDDEGYNQFSPTFETDCGIELQLDKNYGSFYDLQQLGVKKNTTSATALNKFNYIITKPIVDNLDRDGYFIFMTLYIIFMKEIIYVDDNYNGKSLKKRIISFIIFTILFSIISIVFIAIKQKKDELIKVGTEDDELFLQSIKSHLKKEN